jgi:hypothetical protein
MCSLDFRLRELDSQIRMSYCCRSGRQIILRLGMVGCQDRIHLLPNGVRPGFRRGLLIRHELLVLLHWACSKEV